ncbi:universal stress protein [Paraburkholderia lycopersici]|uniref:Nucleotide-binding universal stress protein, UspA family n=1 Tax=Paraburkholderia lycopersici TaxID=416944 RepID=A0A1G6SF73_9BURK|nr:universal stress protein [Paraburkholderia lycopersici]SDD14816.1 Nucleotide-binding universal stress protein, UspA family [Paraburkholderia lycopersici]
MCYKSLLVHLDDSERCAVRLALSLELAERFDAHLTGLYLPRARSQAPADARLTQTREHFLLVAERAGRTVEWRAPQPYDAAIATMHARHADLLVLGQPEAGDWIAQSAGGLVADLLMTAGRPAIVVPHTGAFEEFAQNVLVAWDGSREAARAVSDALPLLQQAQCVSIEVIASRHGAKRDQAANQAIEAAAWLDLHGVQASFHERAGDPAVQTGAALLSRASDLRADLMVAGAYAHSRVHEYVLGGVTRTLLEAMTVPVLMSH